MKRLEVEASFANEIIEGFKMRLAEVESRLGLLTFESEDFKKEVHICKTKVNARTKQVENSNNL